MDLLFRLRDAGNTILVIEHNLSVINLADWIIDLGPGGGRDGGELVFAGPRTALEAWAPPGPGERSEAGAALRRWRARGRRAAISSRGRAPLRRRRGARSPRRNT